MLHFRSACWSSSRHTALLQQQEQDKHPDWENETALAPVQAAVCEQVADSDRQLTWSCRAYCATGATCRKASSSRYTARTSDKSLHSRQQPLSSQRYLSYT